MSGKGFPGFSLILARRVFYNHTIYTLMLSQKLVGWRNKNFEAYIRYVEFLKKRRNAKGGLFATPSSFGLE
jgi:hypothetical protein